MYTYILAETTNEGQSTKSQNAQSQKSKTEEKKKRTMTK